MIRKLPELIEAIDLLEKNMQTCEPFSSFGYDNRKQIKTMLQVIKNNHSQLWINSNFLSLDELLQISPDNHLWRAASDAREWLDGVFELDELLYPETSVPLPHLNVASPVKLKKE